VRTFGPCKSDLQLHNCSLKQGLGTDDT
jgi:hypothetical protein